MLVVVAATVGLVAPLAVGATTLEQRAALALLLFAAAVAWRRAATARGTVRRAAEGAAELGARRGAGAADGAGAASAATARLGRPGLGWRGAAVVVACLALVAVTAPAAVASERVARSRIETRAAERLLALGLAERALPRAEQARTLDPSSTAAARGLAAAHLALAEEAVGSGLSAPGYATAGDHLDAALAADPSNAEAARLAEAVKAVRHADAIWNNYDWPATIAELRKAASYRPDLPGLADKLRDAEFSAAAASRR